MKQTASAHHPSIGPSFRLVGLLIFACLIIGIPGASFAYSSWYAEKIFPGVVLAHLTVGGKSKEYSEDILREYSDRLQSTGALFRYGGKTITLSPQSIPLGSDSPTGAQTPLFDVDVEKTKDRLFAVGRTGSFLRQQGERIGALFFSRRVDPVLAIDPDRLTEALKKEFSFFHSPARDASFIFNASGALAVRPETSGIEFDYARAKNEVIQALSSLTLLDITLAETIAVPAVTTRDLAPKKKQAEDILSRAPLTLNHTNDSSGQSSNGAKNSSWNISAADIVAWLTPVREQNGTARISLDGERVRAYLDTRIAPDVLVPVQHPRFEMHEGRVTVFQPARSGKKLDTEKTARSIEQALLGQTNATITITLKEEVSTFADTPRQNSTITDLLAHDETSFAGSPANRRKNIALGASRINGLLIEAGEEFSLIKALGSIDGASGFLPELVIKGNATKPEFGGGLCQVSTTLFRAVSHAGLSILERRNHSYRVSYYEPPVGFDATIYDPSPDFRFKNDTRNPLLIQSWVKGNSIIVELWGKNDGRRVQIDTPTVFNIKKAGETKIIETPDLPPGEKKCTERAHDGADAFFERRIFYADGTIKKETYKSHYVVWPAVCLVGKKPVAAPEQPAVSVPQVILPTQSEQAPAPARAENPPDTLNGSSQ